MIQIRRWLSHLGDGARDQADVDEVRVTVLRPVLLALPVIAQVLVIAFSVQYELLDIRLAWLIPSLIALSLLGHALLRHGPMPTAFIVTTLLFVMVTGVTWISVDSPSSTLFALVAVVAVVTISPVAGFVVAVAATATILVVLHAALIAMSTGTAAITIFLVWTSALLAWATSRPVFTALGWAWNSYSRALAVAEELREHQQELTATVKSLNDAYDRLEHLNDELARARRAADEARRLKAEFAANISHELRTPLNLIIGFSETMATTPETYRGQHLPEVYRADVDTIYRNACHLSGLIDDVLELSKIEISHVGMIREPVQVIEVVQEAVAAVASLFQTKSLFLNVDVPDSLPEVSVDRTRIRQVLINLLTNASRYTIQGGATVAAHAEERDVVISVTDTGIGIAPEELPKVFEEFYRVGSVLRRQVGGTGLGLTISKQLVEMHGGTMRVESQVGEGTTFHVALPLAQNVVSRVPERGSAAWDRLRQLRQDGQHPVAIAARNPTAARVFERHLSGFELCQTPDLESAHRLASEGVVEALVAVASSPSELLQQILGGQFRGWTEPIVFCSLPGCQDAASELGVQAFLVKPVSRQALLRTLEGLGGDIRNVLIVDDDPDMVRLMGRMVRSSDQHYSVWRANSGHEALALLRTRRPDVVLLDLVMPQIDGRAVLSAMREDERLRGVPVVVVTSQNTHEVGNSGVLVVTRPSGLSVHELMSCLSESLTCLTSGRQKTDQARSPALRGADRD